jgi:hypothetical protein
MSRPVICSDAAEFKADHRFLSSIYMAWQSKPQRQTSTNHLALATIPNINAYAPTLAEE